MHGLPNMAFERENKKSERERTRNICYALTCIYCRHKTKGA